MNKGPFRISVIITSYNQKNYLREAVESVINQTVRPHEIIIADDCSCDGSISMIHEYMERFPGWIRGVFQKENAGIPRNRNAALKMITGSHVSILDGDDLFRPAKIEREVKMIAQDPGIRCVYSNVQIVDFSGQPLEIRDKENQPSGNIFVPVAEGKFGLLRSMLIDYSLLKEVGFMDERFPKYDGFDLTVRLAKNCRFAYIPEPLVDYRVHPESDSRGLTMQEHLQDLEGIRKEIVASSKDLSSIERQNIIDAWDLLLYQFRVLNALEKKERIKALFLTASAWRRGWASDGEVRHVAREILPESIKKLLRQCRALMANQKI
jgi:glycosyltransferase involved in cell wall biosynthesis